MRPAFAIILLSALGLASSVELAAARDGCGPGRFYNGYRCVSEYGYPGTAGYGRYYAPRNLGNGIIRGQDGRLHCADRRFTIQDGVCKPYRGY
jgi:hypothetical protein